MQVLTSTRAHGDLAIDVEPERLEPRQRSLVDLPWVWLRQVHGPSVVVVDHDEAEQVCGQRADALVSAATDLALAVQSADCAPVAIDGGEVIAVAHAGWRGLHAGVLAATVGVMVSMGATSLRAALGPCIHSECYEFDGEALESMVERFGPGVVARTTNGRPSLDMVEAVRAGLREVGVGDLSVPFAGARGCTACNAESWYSHRARSESERMATVVWRTADETP